MEKDELQHESLFSRASHRNRNGEKKTFLDDRSYLRTMPLVNWGDPHRHTDTQTHVQCTHHARASLEPISRALSMDRIWLTDNCSQGRGKLQHLPKTSRIQVLVDRQFRNFAHLSLRPNMRIADQPGHWHSEWSWPLHWRNIDTASDDDPCIEGTHFPFPFPFSFPFRNSILFPSPFDLTLKMPQLWPRGDPLHVIVTDRTCKRVFFFFFFF